MTRHSFSHGAATLITTVAAALLVEVGRSHVPTATRALDSTSRTLLEVTQSGLSPEFVSAILLATLLALIWGLAFGILERFRDD